jgi:poly(A) polymerase Pap1
VPDVDTIIKTIDAEIKNVPDGEILTNKDESIVVKFMRSREELRWFFERFYDKLTAQEKKKVITKVLLFTVPLVTFGYFALSNTSIFNFINKPVIQKPTPLASSNSYRLKEERFLSLENLLKSKKPNYKRASFRTVQVRKS